MDRWINGWMSRWADDRTRLKDKNMDGWVNGLMLDMSVYGRVGGYPCWVSNMLCPYWLGNDQVLPFTTLVVPFPASSESCMFFCEKSIRLHAYALTSLVRMLLEGREQ